MKKRFPEGWAHWAMAALALFMASICSTKRQAQTLANVYQAIEADHEIVPVY